MHYATLFASRWMYLQQYSEPDCTGDVTTVSGVPVGVCMIEYDSSSKAVGSLQYTCDSGDDCFFCACSTVILVCWGVTIVKFEVSTLKY